ncbi:MAG: recombinase family protein [Verrucomicrobiota bacterium]
MRTAYSYQRFSSTKQKKGDSTRRQNNSAVDFCKAHGLILAETFRDDGVSAFRGKNFSNESALGEFLRLVENGTVKQGSVLVIENMDRLSRQSILPCLSKFTDIISKGVSIGVISQNRIFDVKSITENPMELILVLVEFSRANNESQTKSTRSKSVIQARIDRVKKGEKVWFGPYKPSWIIGLKNNKFVLDEERVAIVRDIFARYLRGQSCNGIANELNKAKVATLRKFPNGIWTNSTVADVLQNKNVVGWFGINGHEFDNYFPSIISAADYKKVQARLDFNVKNRGGSKYGLVRNLFKGLMFCDECGQVPELKMGMYRNVKGGLNHYAHYICRGVKQHTGCKNVGRVAVPSVELAIFESVLFQHPSNLSNQEVKVDATHLKELEDKHARVELVIARQSAMVSVPEFGSLTDLKADMMTSMRERDELVKQIKAERNRVNQKTEFPKASATLFSLFSLQNPDLKKLADWYQNYTRFIQDTNNRKILKNLMPAIFDRITFRFHVSDSKPPTIKTNINCNLVGGDQVGAVIITSSSGTVISRNDPATKKPIPFRLTASGKRIPLDEPKKMKRIEKRRG